MNVLSGLPGIIASAMGQTLFRAATLHAKTPRVPDGRGGFIAGTIKKLKCRALVTEFTDYQRMMGNVAIDGAADEQAGIAASDRNIIILAATLSGIPKAGDTIVIDGEAWNIATAKSDPANATYECKSSRVPIPSGDTTEATNTTLLDTLPGIMNDALGPALFSPATLYIATGRELETRGGTIATYTEATCSALIVDYTDMQRGTDRIPSKDRRALILSASLTGGLQPKVADILVVEGKAWGFVTIGRDPAGATYDAQATPAKAPSVGRTGSLVRTLDSATLSATGSLTILASTSINLDDAIMLGAGTPIIVGAMNATLGEATGAGEAESFNRGVLAITLDETTLEAAGEAYNEAAGGGVLADATLAATGSVTILGALAITLDGIGLLASSVEIVGGALSVVLDDATGAAEGYQRNVGDLVETLADASLGATGSPAIVGSAALSLDAATVVAEGYQRNVGDLAITLDAATLSASSDIAVSGALAVTLDEVTAISNGTITNPGAGSGTLDDTALVAEGYQANWGASAVTLDDATVSSTGSPRIVGASAATLGDATVIGAGYQRNAGALAVTLDSTTSTAAGTSRIMGASAVTLDAVTSSAAGYQLNVAVLAITLDDASLSSAGEVRINGVVSLTLDDATLSSAGTVTAGSIDGALSVTLDDATLSSAGSPLIQGAASVTLNDATVTSTGRQIGTLVYVGGKAGNFVGATSGNTNVALGSGLSGGAGSAVAAGDFVVVSYTTGSKADRTLAIGDGTTAYTLVSPELYANGTTNDTNLRVAYKFMGSTPDANVVLGPSGNAADGAGYAVHVWRNVDPTTPLDVTPTAATGTATSRPNPPSITPLTANAVVIAATGGAAATGTTAFTFSGASNLVQDNGVDTQDGRASLASYTWSSGALDPAAAGAGSNNAADSWAAITFALRPATYVPPTAAPPVAYAASSTHDLRSDATLTIAIPADVVAGNLMVACIGIALTNGVVTPPSGWTEFAQHSTSDGVVHSLFGKIATGSEPSSYTFTCTGGPYTEGVIFRVTGENPTTPLDVYQFATGTSGSTRPNPGVTTTEDNTLLVYFCGGSDAVTGAPAGMTPIWTNPGSGFGIWVEDRPTAGATGSRAASQTSSFWAATMFAIRSA